MFESETKTFVRNSESTGAANLNGWSRQKLRVITFNAQDLTFYEKPDSKMTRAQPKSEKQIKMAAKVIFEQSPDIIVLQEVGNQYTLQKIADLSVNEAYEAVLIQGHDTSDTVTSKYARHIGFLVKKSLNLERTVATNLRIPYAGSDPRRKFLFDRGLPVISFFQPGKNDKPLFSLIGAHNHSIGENGKFSDLKSMEEKSMVNVIDLLQQAYGEQFPIILAGDLNTEVNGNFRLTKLKSKMVESFDEVNIESTSRQRVTQIIPPKPGSISSLARQIDGVFVNRALTGRIQSSQTLSLPNAAVSDHRPLMVDIDLAGAIP